jgi:acetyl-CoA carboxylase carboxyl transferase subunit alpha
MWRDAAKRELAAEAMRITAPDLKELGCVDEIVAEPEGGAHTDHDAAVKLVDEALQKNLSELKGMSADALISARYEKFRNMAQFFTEG